MTLPPASLWLDAQGLQNRAHFDRGIPRYVNEQLRAILELAPAAVAAVGVNRALPLTGNLDWLLGSGRLHWTGVESRAPKTLPALYHVMSPIELGRSLEEVWPRWARGAATKTVVTVFDLIPLVFEEHYLRDPQVSSRYRARLELIRAADHVLALSQTTADDVVERLHVPDGRVTVIDAGVAGGFHDATGSADESRRRLAPLLPALRPGYLLYVAGIEFRKNLERLIEAHGLSSPAHRAAHQLVITCRMAPEERAHLLRCGARAGLGERDLLLTGYVSDAELAALYRGCELFVFASFYEGSGLPVLEAMASGAPVAASNTSTSPEILGDLEATFDPFDPRDIARVLEHTLADRALMKRLRERSRRRVAHYTWQHVARRSLEGYERALERRRAARLRPRRPLLALFTPWPPDRSGIADYNRRLVQELGRRVDVDVVVAGPRQSYPVAQQPGTSLVHAGDLAWKQPLRRADRHAYCMGNSHFHGHVYEGLCSGRGVVVAHDVRLTGFYGWYSGVERPTDPASRLSERIKAMYGDRLGPIENRAPAPAEQSALGIYMTHEIQEYAEHVIVHSRYAADILRLDRPLRGADPPPITVLAHAFTDEPPREPRRPDPAAPLIATFGVVSSVKNPQAMIEALALLAADRPGARLVFAGGADESELERWRRVAADAGVADRVSLHGHVEPEQWDELLRTADVAVQLRLVSNGEASGAVAHCMARGLPLVVTGQGWFAELPHDAVVTVPVDVSAPALARAIAGILDDDDRAQGLVHAALDHARANSFAAVAERYLEVLELI